MSTNECAQGTMENRCAHTKGSSTACTSYLLIGESLLNKFEEMLCEKLNGSEEMRPKVLNSNVYRPGPITRVMFLYVCVRFR